MSTTVRPMTETSVEAPPRVDFWQRPLRVASTIIGLNIAGQLLFALVLAADTGDSPAMGVMVLPSLVAGFIALMLWQERARWGSLTFWLVAVSLFVVGAPALEAGDWLTLVSQISYSCSLMMVLKGTPSTGNSQRAFWLNLIGNVSIPLIYFFSIPA